MIYTHFTLKCRNQTFDLIINLQGKNFEAKPDHIENKKSYLSVLFT